MCVLLRIAKIGRTTLHFASSSHWFATSRERPNREKINCRAPRAGLRRLAPKKAAEKQGNKP